MTLLLLVAFLVMLPAATAFFAQSSFLQRSLSKPAYQIGAPIVYQHEEVTNSPIAGVRDLRPSEHGEYYYYSILDYLRVIEVLRDGRIVAVARDRQRLCFWPDNSSLRKANLTERLFHSLRFPA